MAVIDLATLSDGSLVDNVWTPNAGSNGIFDKLIEVMNSNIEAQYNSGRITGVEYANVYLGSLQTIITQSVQYLLSKQLQEAQIEGVLADNALKAQELMVKQTELHHLRNTTEAELEQQWGYEVTRDAVTGELILGAWNGTGKIDKEKALLDQQNKLAYTDRIIKDKQAVALGLDNVIQSVNDPTVTATPYTPQYSEGA